MKPYVLRFAAASAIALALSTPVLAAEHYTLDPMHTAVTWHINHFGFSQPSGKFMNAEGSVTLDEKNPQNSSVTVTIPLSGVNSGVAKLDEHLKTKDFFETETYPNATFESTKVELTGNNTAHVTGNLTLHGVTKPVTLNVRLNQLGENMFKKKTAGFSAKTTLKRSDFGMVTYLPGLGDEVTIDIESEANLAEAATSGTN